MDKGTKEGPAKSGASDTASPPSPETVEQTPVVPDVSAAPAADLPDLDESPAARQALADLGIDVDATAKTPAFSIDGDAVPIVKHIYRFIRQVDALKSSAAWKKNLTVAQRRLVIGAHAFALECVGEKRRGDYSSLKEALGTQYPSKLFGVMSDTTNVARARRRGTLTPEMIAEITQD